MYVKIYILARVSHASTSLNYNQKSSKFPLPHIRQQSAIIIIIPMM